MNKTEHIGLIIPSKTTVFLNQEEITCGLILVKYFKSSIKCIPSSSNTKSPDFLVVRKNQRWELKTIRGNSDNTIHHAFARSHGQSENLILFLSKRSKMRPKSAIGRIKRELKTDKTKQRVLLVTNNGAIVAIKP